jgi:hypothetical protein
MKGTNLFIHIPHLIKTINDLKKENFSLKLKIFFLEERMGKMAPKGVRDAFKEVLLSEEID